MFHLLILTFHLLIYLLLQIAQEVTKSSFM